MTETKEKRERALVVGVNLNQDLYFEESIEELKNLALACDIEPVGEVVQNLQRPNNTHYVGTGKLTEIRDLIDQEEIDVLIFEDELTPSQIRNLSKHLDIEILDRTRLILDIFANRAQTKEAKMRVEIARLRYALPRLRVENQNFGHQRGGGAINRGAGETKQELKRRKVEDKIAELEQELKNMVKTRQIQRKKRAKSGIPTVALVGYTNAGKSTIMNAMVRKFQEIATEKTVFEKDMLFATLDTSVRHIKFEKGKSILLSDTVGFINKLPHHLVKAFHSTLEEAREADLLLHVVDVASPNHRQHIDVTNETLKEIGAGHIDMAYVYNKIDLVEKNPSNDSEEVLIKLSAKKDIGFESLFDLLKDRLFSDYRRCQLLIPYDQGGEIPYLKEHGTILEISYEDTGTLLDVELRELDFEKYGKFSKE